MINSQLVQIQQQLLNVERQNKRILVTGGTGLLGRHLQEIMPNAVYIGSDEANLSISSDVKELLGIVRPHTIVHLAGRVGGIFANTKYPAEFFEDNIRINTFMVECARLFNVQRFIGILSTCIYPEKLPSNSYPLDENELHNGPPPSTNLPYAMAKRCLAVHIDAYNQQYGTKYNYVIPSNLFGKYDHYNNNEDSHFTTMAIKKVLLQKLHPNNPILNNFYGNGSPLRQFLYAGDLARVLKIMVERDITDSFNVAPQNNISLKEFVKIAANTIGIDKPNINFNYNGPIASYRKNVSNVKMMTLIPDFQFTPLEDALQTVFAYLQNNQIETFF